MAPSSPVAWPRSARDRTVGLGVAIAMMASIGALYAWSVLVAPIEQALGSSRASVSLVFSIAIACFTLAMLWGARLQRRLSPAGLALLSGMIAALGLLLPAASPSPASLLVGIGVGFGIANGLGYGLAIALAQASFPARRGLVTGIAVASYTAGSAVWSPLLGWGAQAFGLAGTLSALSLHMLVTTALGAGALLATGASFPARPLASRGATDAGLGRPVFIALWLGFFLSSLAGLMVLGHAAAILAWQGGDLRAAALAAGLVVIANGVGRLAGGWLSDRTEARLFLAAGMLAAAGGLALAWAWPGPGTAYLALLAIGLGYGAMAGAYPAVVAKLYGATAASAVYARVFTSWGLAGLAAPYAAGLLFDRSQSYGTALLASAIAALAAAAACRAIPRTRAG